MEGETIKLSGFRRIFKTDYAAEYQGLVDQLANSLNTAIESLFDLTNKKISFRDNINCTVRDVEITVDASGKPTSGTGMTLDTTGRVDGLMVIRVENLSNSSTFLSSAPFIEFSTTQDGVIFNHITGLTAGIRYRLRVIAIQS